MRGRKTTAVVFPPTGWEWGAAEPVYPSSNPFQSRVGVWCTNTRRQQKDLALATTHLVSQTVADIWGFKQRKAKDLGRSVKDEDIATVYNNKMVNPNSDAEPRNAPTTISNACIVYDKIFIHKECMDVLEYFDTKYGQEGPFNSITKLIDVYYRFKSQRKLGFFFTWVQDQIIAKGIEVGDCSQRKLRTEKGKVGLMDMVGKRLEMKDHMLSRFIDTRNISAECKARVRDIFASVFSYRQFRKHDGSV